MAIPTVVAVGAVSAGTGDVTPGLPTGWAADDIHIMLVAQSGVNNFGAAPTGWTLVTNTQQRVGTGQDDGVIQVFWRRAVGGDTDPTVTDTINQTIARIIGIRGCPTSGDPWNVTNGSTDATANTSLSVTGNTTTVADCLVIVCFGTGVDISSTTEVSGWTNADLGSVTERMDNWHTGGNGGGFGMATGTKAVAGAYGATTATLVTSANKAFATIALKPATVAYTLTASAGSYGLTGNTASLLWKRVMAATAGIYALTGNTAALKFGHKIAATAGVYTLTGNAITNPRTYILTSTAGTYALTGNTAALKFGRKITADAGSYTLTGNTVTFPRTYILVSTAGVYSLTGNTASLLFGHKLMATAGVYILTGNAVTLDWSGGLTNYTMTADAGVYTLTGNTASLLFKRVMAAIAGSYTLSGQDVNLLQGHRITAGAGTYALTGSDASLLFGHRLNADTGTYTLTGNDVQYKYNHVLTAGVGQYLLTGQSVTFSTGAPGYSLGGLIIALARANHRQKDYTAQAESRKTYKAKERP